MAGHYKDLIAWQKAMDLVVAVYGLADLFPKRETFALSNQVRRAAVSVPSNIAEGQAHRSTREFMHFLQHARGSLAEVETQLRIAVRLNYVSDDMASGVISQADEIGKIINGLISSLEKKITQSAG